MSWLQKIGQSDDPNENTAPKVIGRIWRGLEALAGAAAYAVKISEREHARMVAAEERLGFVNKMLWDWVAGEFSENGARPEYEGVPDPRGAAAYDLANRHRIMELGAALGEDMDSSNVALELQKRASAKAAAEQGPLCVCGHERALHPDGGRCIGYHRASRGEWHAGTIECDRFQPLAEALAP